MPTGTKPRPAFPLGSTFTTQSAFIGRCETGRRWRSSTTAPPHWLALAVDMWTTQQRCPQTHSSRRSLWRHDKKEKERTRFPTRNHPPLVLMTGSTSRPTSMGAPADSRGNAGSIPPTRGCHVRKDLGVEQGKRHLVYQRRGAEPRSGYRLLRRYFYRPASAHRRCHCWPRLRPGRRPRSNRQSAQRAHGTAERGAAAKRHQERLREVLRHLRQRLGSRHAFVDGLGHVRRNPVGAERHLGGGPEEQHRLPPASRSRRQPGSRGGAWVPA